MSATIVRPYPELAPGDVMLDNSGRFRRVVSFAPDSVACSQNHVSSPGSRVVLATWMEPVRWRNPDAGSTVWEHTLRPVPVGVPIPRELQTDGARR